jgi:hypothetical protein
MMDFSGRKHMAQIRQISKNKKNSKSPEFYDKFQICSQEYKKEFF